MAPSSRTAFLHRNSLPFQMMQSFFFPSHAQHFSFTHHIVLYITAVNNEFNEVASVKTGKCIWRITWGAKYSCFPFLHLRLTSATYQGQELLNSPSTVNYPWVQKILLPALSILSLVFSYRNRQVLLCLWSIRCLVFV